MYLRQTGLGGIDWIDPAEVRKQWWAVLKVMSIRFS
jgi:hypothetical protein